MKTLKTIHQLGLMSFVFLVFGHVQAQQAAMSTSPETMANQQTKYEAAELKLDAKEAIDLAQVNLLYAQQMIQLRNKASEESSRNEIEALKRSHSNKIRSLLSTDKYRKYMELKKMDDNLDKKKDKDK